jgi:hypothetical protein
MYIYMIIKKIYLEIKKFLKIIIIKYKKIIYILKIFIKT